MLANDGSYSHYDRWNPIFFITCRTWLPAPSWAEYHYEIQKGSVIKMQPGILQAIRCYAQFSSKISEQRADTNIQQVVRLEWYLKKRQMRIPRKYNPVGTGFFFTALIPASISAVDSFSSSRACICWFRALSAEDGTCPLISDLVCSACGSPVM
jgi:hypothetical protein